MITMLPTADVVNAVIFDGKVAEGILAGSGVGTDGHDWPCCHDRDRRLASAKLRPDVLFVDAPVSGSKGPAEAGQLLILASGPGRGERNPEPGVLGNRPQDRVAR